MFDNIKTQREQEAFVTCSQGMEDLLIAELEELGFTELSKGFRGVYVRDGSPAAIYKINYCSRIAGRVLLPILSFICRDKMALYKSAQTIDWRKYIGRNKTFAIDANVSNHQNLRNSLFASQVLKDAICDQYRDRFGERPNVDPQNPDVQLNLFISHDSATISFDTSGAPLHKRGYRLETVEAPMRESLAAALLKIANYKGDEIVFDPCCGSGTLMIEAALIASRTPPGYLRKQWGFMLLPDFNQQEWLTVKNEADSKRVVLPKGLISGTDVNKNAVHVTKVNLRASGFYQSIEVSHSDFRDFTPAKKPNFLISNPPHGKRLDEETQLRPLYRSLGDFMKQKMELPGRGFIFTGNLELAKEVGLAPKQRYPIENGGVDSRFLEFDIF